MKAVIDRFEEDLAVLLAEGQEERRPRASLPESAREGDVIDLETGEIDRAARRQLEEKIRAARESAFRGKRP